MMMMNGDQPRSGSSTDPTSFVVLPNPTSLGNQSEGQLHGPRSIAELQASLSQSDMSLEEAMSKVLDLMRENQDLKETVKGHTELMKKQFQVMADLKDKWNAEQEEMKLRHQQAKDVVLGLRESIKEKDDIIKELKDRLAGRKEGGSETSLKETVTGDQVNTVEELQQKVTQLESDNQLLLESKINLGKHVQDLTDELSELREKYSQPAEPEEVFINVSRESASRQAHLISMENKYNANQLQQQYQRKIDVLEEEIRRHIQTIENIKQELSVTKDIKEEIENEYIKLTEEHCMVQAALKDDTDMMKDSRSSIKKIQQSYEKLMKEKQELLALNNQMALQIQSLKGSPISDKSIENMMSPVEESTTSDVLFQRDQYLKEVEKRKQQQGREVAFDTGVIAGDLTSPTEGFTTVTLSGPVDHFINQNKDKEDGTSIGQEIKQAEKLQASSDKSSKRKSREDQAVSDLLLQLQEERSKVTEMMSKMKAQSTQIAELTIKLKDKEHKLVETTKTATKITQEKETERQQLLERIDLLRSELIKVQEEQDEPLQSIGEVQTLQAQIESLIRDLKDTEDKYYVAKQAIETHKERSIDLQAKIEMYQEEIETQRAKDDQLIDAMRTTITSLEAQIGAERRENQMKSHAMQELRTSYDQICSDYHELIKDMEGNKSTKANPADMEKMQREYQSTVDNLTAKLITTEEALMTQREEFMQMRGRWKEMKAENETVPVLKAQAEVFKADFEAERTAREEMASERDRLKESIEQLQLRNQQLLEEMQSMSATQVSELQRRHGYLAYTQAGGIGGAAHGDPNQAGPSPRQLLHMREHVQQQHHQTPDLIEEGGGDTRMAAAERDDRDRSPFDVQRTVAANATTARQTEEVEEPEGFRCPKCQISCPDYDTLNLHVNECLDQD